jgi:succinoglycan biosynthesis protein ExoH
MWMVWNRGGPDFYPAFYIGAVLLSFAILIVTNAQVRSKLPALYGLLTGSRGKKPKPVIKSPTSVAAAPSQHVTDPAYPQRQR